MTVQSELAPIPVVVTNQPEPTKPRQPRKRRASNLTTIIISTTNPVVHLLPGTENRCAAYLVQYTDADVVVCSSESVAYRVSQLPDFTEQVDGALIPKGYQTPVPLDTTDDLWITTNATVLAAGITRVAVLDFLYGP
jgi:hypothetical protein